MLQTSKQKTSATTDSAILTNLLFYFELFSQLLLQNSLIQPLFTS